MQRADKRSFTSVLWQRALLPLLLLALALALRLYHLGAQSLWLDEGGTWAEVSGRTGKGWLPLLLELFSPDAAYPLYHVLLKAWVSLAGDSEWALRFPSALAGAAAVLAVYFAAGVRGQGSGVRGDRETGRPGDRGTGRRETEESSRHLVTLSPRHRLVPALLLATAPFALWQSQDAKVYSLLMLCAALMLWALLHALQSGARRDWVLLLVIALTSLFVHRLALLALAGVLVTIALVWPWSRGRGLARAGCALLALLCAAGAIYGTVRAVGTESRGGTGHIPAGPWSGLWLSFAHFALDRGNINGWLGLPLLIWALPALALTCWGLALLGRDAWAGRRTAIALLCMLWVPLLLFAVALGFAQLFEARYVTVAFPAWVLVLAYPFMRGATTDDPLAKQLPDKIFNHQDTKAPRLKLVSYVQTRYALFKSWCLGALVVTPQVSYADQKMWLAGPGLRIARSALLVATLVVNALVLLQPQHGLFSGAAVKEQWREGIAALASRVHPDDLVILHPYYTQLMWDYYAPRVTPDPLPQDVTFDLLGQGFCRNVAQGDQVKTAECYRRGYEQAFDRAAYSRKRMLMLIATDHARTIDPPLQGDRYGVLGLRFQYSSQQRTWPCGGTGDALIGVEVMCAAFPSFYQQKGAASIPQPATVLEATFGGELHLRGYSLDPLGGAARPGGTLPITLYWDAATMPTHDYRMFLHLCRDCSVPPLANDDGPPLNGYFPAGQTHTWIVNDPVHDERNLALPADLPPGRYALLLGVYPPENPTEAGRLPVVSSSAQVYGGTRLVLGEVTIGR